MLTYSYSGVAVVRGREVHVVCHTSESFDDVVLQAEHVRDTHAHVDIDVIEHDDEREAREGGAYAPRVVRVIRRGDYMTVADRKAAEQDANDYGCP